MGGRAPCRPGPGRLCVRAHRVHNVAHRLGCRRDSPHAAARKGTIGALAPEGDCMNRASVASALTILTLALSPLSLKAEVRADEKTRVEFAGALGRVVNMFGGKAAREGVAFTVAVKGDRKATLNDATGQIIDLSEQK